VLALVVTFVIVIAGVQAISSLERAPVPEKRHRVVTVTTVYIGASAELVRGFITTPLERAIAASEGIDYINRKHAGRSTITVRLKLNYDSNKALSEISSKVNQVRGDSRPRPRSRHQHRVADSRFASAYLSFTSDMLAANEITDYLNRVVQPRLTAVGGVQRAEILGGRTFAMRVWLKPEQMAALNVSPAQVRQALAQNNYLAAPGSTKGALVQVNLTANTDLHTVDDFKNLVVRQENGALVRLSDVADVVLGAEDYNTEVRFSGQRAVFMGIFVLPNANSIDVVKRVRTEMEQIQRELPTGMQGRIAYDGTAYINTAIKDVYKTLAETLLIVCVVIFLFLGSWRSTIIPIIAIPISLIGAVFLMQVFGFTINLLTLLAVVLSVGLVVDDAIVVVENVERHLRDGLKPARRSAARRARAGRPDHRDDDHARRGLRPGRYPGRFDRYALPRICVHARGRGGDLWRCRAHALSGDDGEIPPRGRQRTRLRREGEPSLRSRAAIGTGKKLDASLRVRPAVYTAWIGIAVLAAIFLKMSMSAKETRAHRRSGRHLRHRAGAGNATIEQTSAFADAAGKVMMGFPQTRVVFQLTFPGSGFGGMVLKPWDQRKETVFDLVPQVQAQLGTDSGASRCLRCASAAAGGGQFPSSSCCSRRKNRSGCSSLRSGSRRRRWRARASSSRRSSTRRSINRRPRS
jgi:multidrug efflux pump